MLIPGMLLVINNSLSLTCVPRRKRLDIYEVRVFVLSVVSFQAQRHRLTVYATRLHFYLLRVKNFTPAEFTIFGNCCQEKLIP